MSAQNAAPTKYESKKLSTDQDARKQIDIVRLVKRLQNHVLKFGKMSSTQLRAADILLRKVMPDLQALDITGEIEHSIVKREPISAEQWLSKHGKVIDAEYTQVPESTAEEAAALEAAELGCHVPGGED